MVKKLTNAVNSAIERGARSQDDPNGDRKGGRPAGPRKDWKKLAFKVEPALLAEFRAACHLAGADQADVLEPLMRRWITAQRKDAAFSKMLDRLLKK